MIKLSYREDLSEKVYQSLGLASVSLWSEDPVGVFESEKAVEIGEDIMGFVEDNYTPKKSTINYKKTIQKRAG